MAGVQPSVGAGDSAGRTLVVTGMVDAPVETVWRLFTTEEGVESWMAPVAEVDLRVGGAIRTNYNPEGAIGDASSIENTILAFEPPVMLAFRNTKAPEGFPHVDALGETWSVCRFEEVAPGRTRVTFTGLGYTDDPASVACYGFFEAGNTYVLEQLRARVAKDAPESAGVGDEGERAVRTLRTLIGGEWIHEATMPDGRLFRVRNVMRTGPDGVSIAGDGWLGDASGMFHHAATLIWIDPATREARFQSVHETGAVASGPIRAVGPGAVEWDWLERGADGEQRYRITMAFTGPDEYSMAMHRVTEEGETAFFKDPPVFRRVAKAPAEFMKTRPVN